MLEKRFYATGRRKSAVARVYMKEGNGVLTVNKRDFDDYFPRESLKMLIRQPFEVVGKQNHFDCYVNVSGGGISGQAGAVKHAIARALQEYDAELRSVMKKEGFLTRDPRAKERKKYGQPGARKRFQFSKR
ncbi:30S ribosomal protein S9 [Syntrophus aciditrophicus]|nr:30S ribosomal protein S9 [Syntrophus aciditrophicus]OPY17638.1 MAG: 30S ribosomal protein S9 [Syntrophus sp. PtaB.Bin075]